MAPNIEDFLPERKTGLFRRETGEKLVGVLFQHDENENWGKASSNKSFSVENEPTGSFTKTEFYLTRTKAILLSGVTKLFGFSAK